MSVWYSRADRELMARGLQPREHSTLTVEDYKDLVEFALNEAVERSPAKDLVGSARVAGDGGRRAGMTWKAVDGSGKPTGKYDIEVYWSDKARKICADPEKISTYAAVLTASAFHEVRHVEQWAMFAVTGSWPRLYLWQIRRAARSCPLSAWQY